MLRLSELRRQEQADLLIVGGGISGLSAAITAKETNPDLDVLLIDRACASKGWAGKAARTTGLISYVTEEDDPEDFVRYCVEQIGFYLNDQDLMREMAVSSREILDKAASWGVDFLRDEQGKLIYAKWPTPWGTAAVDPDMCRAMSKQAKKLGVRILDRVGLSDLTITDGRVTGGVGFTENSAEPVVFQATAIIFAQGAQDYMITTGWCGTGNAIYAAWRAGAEMRNVEFGNMCDFARRSPEGWIYYGAHGGAHIAHDHLYTSKENISQKYRPGFHSSMDPLAAYAWYVETKAGNGPVFVDLSDFAQKEGVLFRWHPTAAARRAVMAKKTNPPENKRFDVVPGFLGEMSCIKVDHQMATSIPGLYAVGDASGSGSARGGAAPTPPAKIHGTGILNAFFTGMRGGAAAAQYAAANHETTVAPDPDQVDALLQELFVPLEKGAGISPWALIHAVQDVVAPVDYSSIKSGERMQAALREAQGLKPAMEKLQAKNGHELGRALDAKAMVLCAELFYRASLLRQESRGFHMREDIPERDDKNWLKWIILKNNNGAVEVAIEDVPINHYRYRPETKAEDELEANQ